MPMKMGWRWYGEGNDPISLSDIKQIPGVTSIVWALHDKMPGEIWEIDEIQKVADQIHAYGFDMDVVESVNVHDDIKIGLPTRDKYIENYKQCIRNLSKFGVKVICYNFMPVFDWTRTDLFHPVGDGSTALFYEKDKIKGDYKAMAEYIMSFTEKYNMTFPGWEPERMAKLDELFKAYAPVTKEKLWENLPIIALAAEPSGSIESAGITHAGGYLKNAVSVELKDVTFAESVAVKLYRGETLLTTATLKKGALIVGQNYPFVTCCIATETADANWALTPWTPKDDVVPNKVVLFVDDNEMDTMEFTLDDAEWKALPGTVPPSSGTIVITTPSEDTTTKTEDQKNPSTGANDVVAAAVALMAVSALGMAVLSRKK